MTKAELRAEVRRLKAEHVSEFPKLSDEICRSILLSSYWQSAQTILLYHALPDEPNLQPLLDEGLGDGKQILLPVVVKDDLLLKSYNGIEAMQKGAFGILEPIGEAWPASQYPTIDLAIIPGMAFDNAGHRLGRGRGYYDRLLPRLPQAYKLGVCFPFQHFATIPYERHDIPMDKVTSFPVGKFQF